MQFALHSGKFACIPNSSYPAFQLLCKYNYDALGHVLFYMLNYFLKIGQMQNQVCQISIMLPEQSNNHGIMLDNCRVAIMNILAILSVIMRCTIANSQDVHFRHSGTVKCLIFANRNVTNSHLKLYWHSFLFASRHVRIKM